MNVLIMLNKLLNHNYNALLEILYFRRKLNMSIKKINGYKIFLSEELGKGSYGAVCYFQLCRCTKENRINRNRLVQLKSSIRKTVTFLSYQ